MGRTPLKKIIVNSEWLRFIRSPYWELKVRDGLTKAEMRCLPSNQLVATIVLSHNGFYGIWFNMFGHNVEYEDKFSNIEQAMIVAPKFIAKEINKVFILGI
jgi:hypothetical protein